MMNFSEETFFKALKSSSKKYMTKKSVITAEMRRKKRKLKTMNLNGPARETEKKVFHFVNLMIDLVINTPYQFPCVSFSQVRVRYAIWEKIKD